MIKLLESKRQHKQLKVILALGSYDTKSFGFEEITQPNNTEAMSLFSLKLIKFLCMHEFDGVVLDYEFPGMLSRGSYLHSKQGFSLLVRIIKENFVKNAAVFGKPRLQLMASVAARADYIDHFYETNVISAHLDYLLVLTFDMRSSREKKTRITSALFPKLAETGLESTLNQVRDFFTLIKVKASFNTFFVLRIK